MWPHSIYSSLVNDQTGFVGLVAYSIYKQEKIAWIDAFKEEQGRFPSDQELKDYFYSIKMKDGSLKHYLERAESELNQFLDITLQDELLSYKEQLKEHAILQELRKQKRFWPGVWQNVAAGVFGSLMVAGLSLVIWLWSQMQDDLAKQKILEENPVAEQVQRFSGE